MRLQCSGQEGLIKSSTHKSQLATCVNGWSYFYTMVRFRWRKPQVYSVNIFKARKQHWGGMLHCRVPIKRDTQSLDAFLGVLSTWTPGRICPLKAWSSHTVDIQTHWKVETNDKPKAQSQVDVLSLQYHSNQIAEDCNNVRALCDQQHRKPQLLFTASMAQVMWFDQLTSWYIL